MKFKFKESPEYIRLLNETLDDSCISETNVNTDRIEQTLFVESAYLPNNTCYEMPYSRLKDTSIFDINLKYKGL